MSRAGQAPSAEACGAHAEIPAILLNHEIRSNLRRPEDAMGRLINAHLLADAISERVVWIDFPPCSAFDKRQSVRRVSVHLVGGGEDEDCVRTIAASRLQHVQRSDGIDAKIGARFASSPIV